MYFYLRDYYQFPSTPCSSTERPQSEKTVQEFRRAATEEALLTVKEREV